MMARQLQPWLWVLVSAALALPGTVRAQYYPPGVPLTNAYGGPLSPSPFTAYGPAANIPYRGYGSPEWTFGTYAPLSSRAVYPYAVPADIYNPVPTIQPLYPRYPGAYTGYSDQASEYQALRRPTEPFTPPTYPGLIGRPGTYVTFLLAAATVGPFAASPTGTGPLPSLTLSAVASAVPTYNLEYRALLLQSTASLDLNKPEELARRATVDVTVPSPAAEVWVEGQRMHLTGTFRHFLSPPLAPAKRFAYEVRASWQENGQTVSRTRNIEVRAGSIVRVDFTTP